MFTNYVCPFCGHNLYFEQLFYRCNSCHKKFDILHNIPQFDKRANHYGDPIHNDDMSDSTSNTKWGQRLEKIFNDFQPHDVRAEFADMHFLEARAGWKYLTDLSNTEYALVLGHGMEITSLNLCRTFNNVFAMGVGLDQLMLANKMGAAKGIKNLNIVRGGDTQFLPFPSDFFDLICVNDVLERVPLTDKQDRVNVNNKFLKGFNMMIEPWSKSNPVKMQMHFLNEINRILKPNGTMYLAIENRFNYRYFLKTPDRHMNLLFPSIMPRFFANLYSLCAKGESYRSYSHSYFGIKKILIKCNFKQLHFYSMKPDHRLFHEIIFLDKMNMQQANQGSIKERIKNRLFRSKYLCPSFGIIARKYEDGGDFIRSILKIVAYEHKRTYKLSRYHVMMKGNVVLDIVDVNDPSHGLIIKIPVDDISETQNRNNYAMLSSIHKNSFIPEAIKGLIPRPAGKHTINCQNIYVEDKMNGIPAIRTVSDNQAKDKVLTNALDFLVSLHKATLTKVIWSEKNYIQKIGNMIERLKRVGKYGQDAFEKIDRILRNEFIGRDILLAQKHGDFSFANILIDPDNYSLLGIIDWDNSEYDRPILIDLINLIESTYSFKNLELGFTVTNILLKNNLSREETVILHKYISIFGYSENVVLPYTLLYWLYHFDSQIKYDFLIHNPEWMRENYYNVIVAINNIF